MTTTKTTSIENDAGDEQNKKNYDPTVIRLNDSKLTIFMLADALTLLSIWIMVE